MSGATKDSKNPHFKSSYASLAPVVDAIRAPLAKHEIGWTQQVSSEGTTVSVVTILLHSGLESGEYRSGTMRATAKVYEKHVVLERVVPIDPEESETLVVYSRLGELLMDGFLAQDIEEGMIPIDDVETLVSAYFISFINFIKLLDNLVHHQADTHEINRVSSTPIQE